MKIITRVGLIRLRHVKLLSPPYYYYQVYEGLLDLFQFLLLFIGPLQVVTSFSVGLLLAYYAFYWVEDQLTHFSPFALQKQVRMESSRPTY